MSGGIVVTGLVVGYGRRRVLDGVNLTVAPGEVVVLLGENGAGKSTLLRALLGLLPRARGEIRVRGLDPATAPDAVRGRVGFVPDRPDVPGWMTVAAYLRFVAAHHVTWSDAVVSSVLEVLSVPTNVPFRALSKGQGMKAMLAAALGSDPDVLVLDEPFSGLDPMARDEVLRSVIRGFGTRPRAVLCATHDLSVAARLADRMVLLTDGRLTALDPEAAGAASAAREGSPGEAAWKAAMAAGRVS